AVEEREARDRHEQHEHRCHQHPCGIARIERGRRLFACGGFVRGRGGFLGGRSLLCELSFLGCGRLLRQTQLSAEEHERHQRRTPSVSEHAARCQGCFHCG